VNLTRFRVLLCLAVVILSTAIGASAEWKEKVAGGSLFLESEKVDMNCPQ